MKKKVYRERYKDFKVLDKEELKEVKKIAEVVVVKPKRKRIFKKVEE